MDALKQYGKDTEVKDGMNIGFCKFDHEQIGLPFAGALFPLYYFRNGQLHKLNANIYPIGMTMQKELKPFEQVT